MREGAWRVRAGLLCLYVGWLKHELAFQAGCSVIVCQCRVRFFPLLVLCFFADQMSAISVLVVRSISFFLISQFCLLAGLAATLLAGWLAAAVLSDSSTARRAAS